MADRVTIQDIADALGLSRNTVSKAINNTGVLADATREKVLKKASEMGYKQFSYINVTRQGTSSLSWPPKEEREIALFTTRFLDSSHFASLMLDKFQREVTQMGYILSIHRVLSEEVQGLELPRSFDRKNTAGIICYEMFDHAYSRMLCELDLPVLFVDSPAAGLADPLKADRLSMDNQSGIFSFVREIVRRGKTQIGFIGEYLHCQSFFERYMAYRNALCLHGLSCPENFCILENRGGGTPSEYQEYLFGCFQKLNALPDVWICANDFVALDVIHVLRRLGYRVPQDVWLCGFDDSPESRIVTPSLTTVHIHSQIMGFSAAHLLISRIKEPSLDYRTLYTETELIFRESTGD